MSQIEKFKSTAKDQPESEAATDESGILFQLNYKPEHARLQQTGRVAELEGRIKRLEQVLGSSDDKLARLTAATSKGIKQYHLIIWHFLYVILDAIIFLGSLLETAQHLSATASLLDSSQLNHIEGRLTALSQKLDTIAEKKKAIVEDAEKDKMVSKRIIHVHSI